MTVATVETVQVDGRTLAYRDLGDGPPVLLLHGWPTSSFLWRNVMAPMAEANRVLALDLPGFGASDKPLDVRYDFDLHERAIDGFLDALGVAEVGLAAHDIGGPIGVHWALRRPDRVTRLALLNTLLYPDFDDLVLEFVSQLSRAETRGRLTSAEGLEWIARLGLAEDDAADREAIAALRAPFASEEAQEALAKAGIELPIAGFQEIAAGLPTLRMPVRVVYGARDRILPDVARTVERVARDVPHAVMTVLPDCGHFLQEEAPDEVGRLLADFFG